MSRRSSLTLPGGGGGGGGVGPGPRVPLDANTLLAYYCDEASGATIVNHGTASGCDLTLTGANARGDLGLFSHGTAATRFFAPNNTASTYPGTNDGAYNSSVSIALSGPCTVEAVVACELVPGAYGGAIFQATDALQANGIYLAQGSSPSKLQAAVINSGSYLLAEVSGFPLVSGRLHVAAVNDGSTVGLWVNGARVATTSCGPLSIIERLAMANTVAQVTPFRGLVAEVRLSNIARPESYLRNAALTIGAL